MVIKGLKPEISRTSMTMAVGEEMASLPLLAESCFSD